MQTQTMTQTTGVKDWSVPKIVLRLEGLALLVGAVAAYASRDYSWLAFGLLLLSPDLSAVGYLANVRVGAMTYNLFHTYLMPGTLIGLSLVFGWVVGLQLGLIWLAHIGMDRLFGYGIKYPTEFKDTHLDRV